MTISVTVNGKPRSLPEPITVARFLETLNINPLAVAVELRGEALSRERFTEVTIEDGDAMEVVRMMGGG
jgi:thiamine biosynthesis protein ThiS